MSWILSIQRIAKISLALLLFSPSIVYSADKCLLVMSYHQGYPWNDGIEQGVKKTLKGRCDLTIYYMDTKRNTSSNFAVSKANEVKKIIAKIKPDVVIASDDNASKYVVTQYKDSSIPFVFAGVNWTAEVYGFPYKNVTGMVEVAPILPLLQVIKKSVKNVKQGVYISSDVITEHKDYVQYKKVYAKKGVKLSSMFVKTMKQWKAAYIRAQSADFIIINNNAGIIDWDAAFALKIVNNYSKKFTVTNYKWMMPYVMFAVTKNSEEQGRWAAQVALAILSGLPVSDIPITVNKEWNMFVNNEIMVLTNISLDPNTIKRVSLDW